jgi:membrane associated rhomboid family serine protease
MNSYGSSEDHQPLTWIRGYPVYAAHGIVLVYILSMLATTILMASSAQGLLEWLPFQSERVLRGEVWRFFTYGFLNPPSIWFVVDMFMIAWFGRELEKFFGLKTFLSLYAGVYFSSPLVLTVVGLWRPTSLAGSAGAFALFIAFATLYPNVSFFFNILAKWLAIILVGIYTLIALSGRDTVGLISLWTTVSFAFAFVRYQQGLITFPSFRKLRSSPVSESPFRTPEKSRSGKAQNQDAMAEVDALLDKIAQSGFGSLTPKERARLDSARAEMMKKEQGR